MGGNLWGVGGDGGMMEWVSSITEIIREWKLCGRHSATGWWHTGERRDENEQMYVFSTFLSVGNRSKSIPPSLPPLFLSFSSSCFLSSPLHSCLCVVCPISEAFQGLKWRLAMLKCLHCCAWACNSLTVCVCVEVCVCVCVCVCPSLQFTNFTAN